MVLQESGEMYLEDILVLSKTLKNVRSKDVADFMGFSKPSVSRAMGILKENGYIVIDNNGFITLSDTGLAIANKIYDRHVVVSGLLMKLGVSEQQAVQDACRIEHVISDESFSAIKKYLAKIEK